MQYLESVEVDGTRMQLKPFRLPVQWVNRPDLDFRGFAGTIASGVIRPGDRVGAYPSGVASTVERIVTQDGDLDTAVAGQAVTLVLADEIDVSRGDLIADAAVPPEVADSFEATIVWMDEKPMLRGRTYFMRVGTRTVGATIAPLKYKLNLESLEHVAATHLDLNEIGVCAIELSEPIAFDPYTENRDTGGFILVDRITNQTVGAGLLRFALRRSQNVHWQVLDVDKGARAAAKQQRPCVLWFTGLSGAGKSTIANLVERRLHTLGCHTYLLDGDNVRHGLNKDLGFTDADRVENIRRVAEVAKLMVDAGLIVVVAFISPFASERRMARALLQDGEFVEVFVDTPLALAEERDPKGLYRKARAGELKNFTGIDSPYEPPEHPELRLDTAQLSATESAEAVVEFLGQRGMLP
jgi:bifunctional enzyme CysN/CysC